MFVFYCRMLQEAWFVEFRFIESWPLPKFILYSAVCGVVEYTVIYCTVLYSMAAYIVLCTMTMTVYRRLGPLGILGILQTLISPVLWLPQKRIHWYIFIYIYLQYFKVLQNWPTPATLQISSNKTFCLKEH